jgi:hypothetical protein
MYGEMISEEFTSQSVSGIKKTEVFGFLKCAYLCIFY